jgi:hypothetical protein
MDEKHRDKGPAFALLFHVPTADPPTFAQIFHLPLV